MKRCPECRRDYYDDSLLYCLDDGAALLEGPSSGDEPATAILSDAPAVAKAISGTRFSGGKRVWLVSAVAALVVIGSFLGYRYGAGSADDGLIESIAVLPFINQSGDPNTEYLSEGLTDSIINNLTQLNSIRVSPRSSVFRYKGKDIDPIKAASELGVSAVVTGRVLQRGDDLLVSTELLDIRSNRQIWGEQYNRKLSDALAVQQAISREISERLRMKLTGDEERRLTKRDTNDAEAYASYIKGRYYWNKRTAENVRRAMEEFQKAADRDPNYAQAYAGLADCYVVLGDYAGTATADTLPKAKAFAERAIQLDESLAEAHASLAFAYHQMWRYQEAGDEFRRAIDLGPNYPTAHHWYYLHLRDLGRVDESLAEIKRAQELDPVSSIIATNVGLALLGTGDVNAAIEQFQKVIDLDPRFPRARGGLGLAYLEQGRNAEGVAELQKASELAPSGDRQVLRDLAFGYGKAGNRQEALRLLEKIKANHANKQALGQDVAAVYIGLGEPDQAFEWLEKDFQARDARLARIQYQTPFIAIRSERQYVDLLRRMGLGR